MAGWVVGQINTYLVLRCVLFNPLRDRGTYLSTGEGFWGSKPLSLEAKAMLLLADIIRQLSSGKIHTGSNQ